MWRRTPAASPVRFSASPLVALSSTRVTAVVRTMNVSASSSSSCTTTPAGTTTNQRREKRWRRFGITRKMRTVGTKHSAASHHTSALTAKSVATGKAAITVYDTAMGAIWAAGTRSNNRFSSPYAEACTCSKPKAGRKMHTSASTPTATPTSDHATSPTATSA